MAGSYKNVALGNKHAWLSFLDSNGYPLGGSTSAPSAGATGSGMLRITGIKSAPVTVTEPDVEPVSGDDELIAEFKLSSMASRAFNIEVAVQDMTMNSRLQNVSVETLAGGLVSPLDISNAPEFDVCLILQSRAKKQDVGVAGRAAWSGTFVNLATATPLGRGGFDERGAALYRYHIVPQLAAYKAWGVTIFNADNVPTLARYHEFSMDYPITMHRWTGTGALAAFNTDMTPVSATNFAAFAHRVALTVNSITAASKLVTLSASPAADTPIIGLYQYQS